MKNTESKQGNSDRTSYIFSRLPELADTHVANVEKKAEESHHKVFTEDVMAAIFMLSIRFR